MPIARTFIEKFPHLDFKIELDCEKASERDSRPDYQPSIIIIIIIISGPVEINLTRRNYIDPPYRVATGRI